MNEHQETIDYLASTPDIPSDRLKAIQQWLVEHGAEDATDGAMFSLWEKIDQATGNDSGKTIDLETIKGLQRLLRDIDPQRSLPAASSKSAGKRFHAGWIFMAATLCLLLSVGAFVLGRHVVGQESETVLLAAEGSIGRHTLPDGTRLWLNGGSTVTYADNFDSSDERRVTINGEAYFEVTHNPRRPFIVEMTSMDVRVLGTSFSARSCPASAKDEVVLLSGKVEVESDRLQNTMTLRPDQKLSLDRESNKVLVEPANARAYCRWIQPTTTFDNEPLSDILILLSRRYGLELHADDPLLADARLSITINASQSLDEVTSIIEHLLPVKIVADGRQLTVASNHQ